MDIIILTLFHNKLTLLCNNNLNYQLEFTFVCKEVLL